MAAQAGSMLSRRCPGKQHLRRVPGAFFFPHGHNWLSLRVVGVTHLLMGESWDPFLGRSRSGGRAWFTMSSFSWNRFLPLLMLSVQIQWPASAWTVFFSVSLSPDAVIAYLEVTNPCSWLAVSHAYSFQTPGWRSPCPSGLTHVMLWLWFHLSSILCVVFPVLCLCPALCSCCSLSTVGRLVGATLSSPIPAPFFTAPHTFSLFLFMDRKHMRVFFTSLKSLARLIFTILILPLHAPAFKMFPLLLLHPFFAHLIRLLLFCHLKISM